MKTYTIEFIDSFQGLCAMEGEFTSASAARRWARKHGFKVVDVYLYS